MEVRPLMPGESLEAYCQRRGYMDHRIDGMAETEHARIRINPHTEKAEVRVYTQVHGEVLLEGEIAQTYLAQVIPSIKAGTFTYDQAVAQLPPTPKPPDMKVGRTIHKSELIR